MLLFTARNQSDDYLRLVTCRSLGPILLMAWLPRGFSDFPVDFLTVAYSALCHAKGFVVWSLGTANNILHI